MGEGREGGREVRREGDMGLVVLRRGVRGSGGQGRQGALGGW